MCVCVLCVCACVSLCVHALACMCRGQKQVFINLSQIHNSHLGSSIKLHSIFHLPIRILLGRVKFAEEHSVRLSQEVFLHTLRWKWNPSAPG